MRHGKKFNHLSRKSAHRKAMLSNMACSLITHKRIITTLAKAKALRIYVEPLLTKSKDDSTHNRRTVFSYLGNKDAVTELFREVAPKIADRPGGYVRIIRTGFRQGDAAEMAMVELVDFNDIYTSTEKKAKEKTTRRSRRAGSKKTTEATEKQPVVAVETKVVEESAPVEDTKDEKAETPKAEEKSATTAPEENEQKDNNKEEEESKNKGE